MTGSRRAPWGRWLTRLFGPARPLAARPRRQFRRLECEPLEDRCCPVTVSGSGSTTIPNTNIHAGDTVTITATLHSSDANENGEGLDEDLLIQAGSASFTLATYEATQLFQFQAVSNAPAITASIQNDDGDESADVTAQVLPASLDPSAYTRLQALGGQLVVAGVALETRCVTANPNMVWGVVPIFRAAVDLAGQSFLNLANDVPDPNDQTAPQVASITVGASNNPIDTSLGVTTGEADTLNATFHAYENLIALNTAIHTALNRLDYAGQNNQAAAVAAQQQALAKFQAQLPGLLDQLATHLAGAEQIVEAHCALVAVGPDDVQAVETNDANHGLPANVVSTLRALGANQANINQIQAEEVVQDTTAVAGAVAAPLDFPGLLAALHGGAAVADTAGVFDPTTATWYLRSSNTSGPPNLPPFQYGTPGWAGVVGDWTGSGTTGIGVYNPFTATWYLRNTNTQGAPDTVLQYGSPFWLPVVGDWDGNGTSTVGVFDSSTATWYLKNSNVPGAPDLVLQFGSPGWVPVVGDWDGNGTTTIGVYDPYTATWYLRNSDTEGPPDIVVQYGTPGWLPVVGDWDGNGTTTIGVVNPGTATWYLRNSNTEGPPDIAAFQYGSPGWQPVAGAWGHRVGPLTVATFDPSTGAWYVPASDSPGFPVVTPFLFGGPGWIPLVGDWTGTGHKGIGVYDPSTATWYLRNEDTPGPAEAVLRYGTPGWLPVVGDWDGNGTTTIGVYNPSTATWYLRNSNTPGPPNLVFQYGAPGSDPVVGDWDGNHTTTVGVVNPFTETWYLRNSNTPGPPDIAAFQYGSPFALPVTGDWNGDGLTTVGVVDPGGTRYLRNSNSSGPPDITPFAYGAGAWYPLFLSSVAST